VFSLFVGWLLAAGGAVGPSHAPAQDATDLDVATTSAWVIAAEDGAGERLVDGAQPEGATERLFTARFRYEGAQAATGLRIVLAVPEGFVYVAGSALGPGAETRYSVDGGRTFGAATDLTLPVDPQNPLRTSRPADPADYSHIRWELPGTHPAGLAGLVSFRARLAGAAMDAEAEAEAEAAAVLVQESP
jgi:hypothetical protein